MATADAFSGRAAIHISEEISQPGRRVPQVMIMTMVIGLLTTVPLMIALCLSVQPFRSRCKCEKLTLRVS